MITLCFVIMMFMVFGKMVFWAISAAWGLTRIVLNLVFVPLLLIFLAAAGLLYAAFIALIVYGVVMLVRSLLAK